MPALKGIFVADPAQVTASMGSESVTVVFDKAKQTLRRERDLKRAAKNDDIDGMVRELMAILVSWDVVDETGNPVPITDEILLDLPADALGSLVQLIGEAGKPSSEEGNGSGNTSSSPSAASSSMQGNHQSSTQPSPSPTPSASPFQT